MTFKERATQVLKYGIPVIPVLPKQKKAFITGWDEAATTDLTTIDGWDASYTDHNCAAVAKGTPDSFWFFEVDSKDVMDRIQAETGNDMPDTFAVRSRPGRGHFYFRNTPESLAMGNIAQGPNIKHGDWSARVRNAYVVSPGSVHPSGDVYTTIVDVEPVPAPVWLIEWLKSQRVSGKPANATNGNGAAPLIVHGNIHSAMLTQAGKLRNMGYEADFIEDALLDWVHKFCEPPIDDAKVKTMAKSICKSFPAGKPELLLTQTCTPSEGGAASSESTTANGTTVAEFPDVDENLVDRSATDEMPVFPDWVMQDTSVFENLAKPAAETSSKIPYMVWMPAVVYIMNYLSTKVRIGNLGSTSLSIFLGEIANKGTFKSSCCELAKAYCRTAGLFAEGAMTSDPQIMLGVGSTEGLGLAMAKAKSRNAILYYDELRTAVAKMTIDSSTFVPDLLRVYESGQFDNTTTESKKHFSFEAQTYCISWVWCTTYKSFEETWAKIAGGNTDLVDRCFYLLGPKTAHEGDEIGTYTDPPLVKSVETKKMLDKAVAKSTYSYYDTASVDKTFKDKIAKLIPPRTEVDEQDDGSEQSVTRLFGLFQKFALYFAIDLGLDEIDEDCCERALAVMEYRYKAIRHLRPIEASTTLGHLQQRMVRVLKEHGGEMTYRDWCRTLNYRRIDTEMWWRAENGLARSKRIAFGASTTTKKGPGGTPVKAVFKMKD